jgi:hypothetical protein
VCKCFGKKKQKYHAAAGEIHRYWKQTACLHAHRVSPEELRGHEPGRTCCLRQGGTGHPCSQTCGSQSHMFVNKKNRVPCCRRQFCRVPGATPGLMNHRVSSVNNV